MGGYLAGCAGERSSAGATAALALAIWQRTVRGQTAADAAGDAVRRDIPRDPAPGNCDATSAPQDRKTPGRSRTGDNALRGFSGSRPLKEAVKSRKS